MSNEQVWPPANDPGPLTGAPCALGGQSLNMRQCPSCDGSHEAIIVKELAKPAGSFTHWFSCPNTGDPVSLSLAMLKSGGGIELNGPVCQSLAEAQMAGRWMIAIWHIDQNNAIQCSKHSTKFPVGDYFTQKDIQGHKGCVEMLAELLRQEIGPVQPDLMRAVNPSPLRDLMGALDPNTPKQHIKLPGYPVLADNGSDPNGGIVVPPDIAKAIMAETSADKAQPVG